MRALGKWVYWDRFMKTCRYKNENCRRPSWIWNLRVSGWVITPPTFPKQVGCRIQTWIQTWCFEGFCSVQHTPAHFVPHMLLPEGTTIEHEFGGIKFSTKYKDWPLQHPMLRNIPLTFEKCHHILTPTLLLAGETAYWDSCSSFTWDFQILWRHSAAD